MVLSVDIEKDFATIVDEVGKSLFKVTVAETLDTYGRIATTIYTTSTITGIITPVTQEDERLVGAGWVTYNDYVGYFKITSAITEHMEIHDGSSVFEVIKIPAETELAGTAYITRVGLKLRTD